MRELTGTDRISDLGGQRRFGRTRGVLQAWAWRWAGCLGLWLCLGGASGPAAELDDQKVIEILTQEQPRDRAIRQALAWLRGQQQPDGAVGTATPTALTSLAVMAHLAAGVTFDDRECGGWLLRSLRYVLDRQERDGYFGRADNSRMYGHGIATLMLAEALGMVRDEEMEERLRAALERAVGLTVRAARVNKSPEQAGGWRYAPESPDSDLSLSGWQLMSLHASQQVGITVPGEVIEHAYEYARRNTTDDGRVGYQGTNEHGPALRGLGMLCFAIGGHDADPLVTRIGERILREPAKWNGEWLFYRIYYDAVGLSRARPELWEKYSPGLVELLVKNQQDDGAWPSPPGNSEGNHGRVYLVSMAVLALSVDRHVLPAYQR